MTLHDVAMDWVAEQLGGVVTHNWHRPVYSVAGVEPDVVVNKSKVPQCHQWHEVEVLRLTQEKMRKYRRFSNKKGLWIALPKETSKTFVIHLIEETLEGFTSVRWTGERSV